MTEFTLKNDSLYLPLKRKWFEMTKAGVKTEDYREINDYWSKRLTNTKKRFTKNIMTLGYPKTGDKERILKLEHKGIEIRTGNPEWGAIPGRLYFVILHGNILKNE